MSGSSFEVIIYATTHGPVYAELVGGEKSWYAMKLESLVTCQRIWDSLHQPENTPLAQYVATYHSPQFFYFRYPRPQLRSPNCRSIAAQYVVSISPRQKLLRDSL